MTFWQFLTNLGVWLESKTTRGIGIALGIIAILAASNVIPAGQLKWYLTAASVLTYLRGQFISDTVDAAKAIVKQDNINNPPLPLVKPLETIK
jgi:hypothetical protein